MENGALRATSWRNTLKSGIVPVFLTILLGIATTSAYFTILTRVYDLTAIERYYWGIWGFGGYIIVLSLIGFLISIKSSHKLSLLCSIGIPILFTIVIFIALASASTPLKIPQYGVPANQGLYRAYVYNEMVSFNLYVFLISPIAGSFAFCVAYVACLAKKRGKA